MSGVQRIFWSGRAGWMVLALLLGAAASPARADVITGTDSNNTPVSILVGLGNQDGTAAPIVLTNNGTVVNLTLPENGPGHYDVLFGMKAGNNFLNFQQLLNGPDSPNPPDAVTGQFPPYQPVIGGQTYTIAGSLKTSNPIDPNSWNAYVLSNVFSGFPQVGEFLFSTTGDPTLSFSVADPNGNLVHFTDSDAKAPEPASLALAALGLVGLAGYGWRRQLAVS